MRLYVSAPEVGDDAYWSQLSMWDQPTLSYEDVADVLGMTVAGVRQAYARRATTGFPAPAMRRSRYSLWSPRQIYDYITTARPRLEPHIPALFPRTLGRRPMSSVFVAAEQWRDFTPSLWPDPAAWEVAAHYWQPSDGRDGQIIVLYPATGGYAMDRDTAATVGAYYAETRFLAHSQAVAIVTDDSRPLPGGGLQPAVLIFEHQARKYPPLCSIRLRRRLARDVDATTPRPPGYELGWFDLAALLRCDLPWWPVLSRRVEVMARWRPGDECDLSAVPQNTTEADPDQGRDELRHPGQ